MGPRPTRRQLLRRLGVLESIVGRHLRTIGALEAENARLRAKLRTADQ